MNVPPRILTASGRYFDFVAPDPSSICIEDIATALSRICRFTGHARRFYSVAEHCVFVSHLVPREHALAALLHDASEAYLGDVSSPLKQLLPEYRAIEHRVEAAIAERFGLVLPMNSCVKQADLRALVTERGALMPEPKLRYAAIDEGAWKFAEGVMPSARAIHGLTPDNARASYLLRFEELT